MMLLHATGLTKRYGGVCALDDVDLSLSPGEILGLLGANGSGKSTLTSIVAGENRPDDGDVHVDGQPLRLGHPEHARKLGVVVAHQHPELAPDIPVWENVFLGAENTSSLRLLDNKTSRARAFSALSTLKADWDVGRLTGGLTAAEQQLVEIAKAMALNPRVLILDEPTAALASPEVAHLMVAIRKIAEAGTGVIFISHRMAEIEALCSRVQVLCNGKTAGHMEVRRALDVDRVLSWMSGGRGDNPAKDPAVPVRRENEGARTSRTGRVAGVPALRVQHLTVSHRIKDVSLEAYPGEILGVAGLQGHGQEELLDTIAGLLPCRSGTVELNGIRIDTGSPRRMIRHGVCLVPNDRHRQGLWLDHSVAFNLAQVGINFSPDPWRLRRKSIAAFVTRVVVQLRIKIGSIDAPVSTLSGGNQQKVVIGRWLQADTKVLLLSDPTKGVDIMARHEIYEAIRALAAKGTAVIVYASDTEELCSVCDRLIVMFEGGVVQQLLKEDISEARVTSALFGRGEA